MAAFSYLIMNLHFGPKWSWDQTRPEAIEARSQMAEFHRKLRLRQRNAQDVQGLLEIYEHPVTTHFRLGVQSWPQKTGQGDK